MASLAAAMVALIALLHLYCMVLEMFCGTSPWARAINPCNQSGELGSSVSSVGGASRSSDPCALVAGSS